jgi:hypothetical protein
MDTDFLKRYAKEATLLFSSAAVSYFLVFKTDITPPIKPKEFVFSMSVLVEVLAILWVSGTSRARKPRLIYPLTVTLAYFLIFFCLTFSIPTSKDGYREARGFICNSAYRDRHADECPFVLEERLIADASYEPERIWLSWSILSVRALLTALWLLMVWSIVSAIAASVRRQKATRRGAR